GQECPAHWSPLHYACKSCARPLPHRHRQRFRVGWPGLESSEAPVGGISLARSPGLSKTPAPATKGNDRYYLVRPTLPAKRVGNDGHHCIALASYAHTPTLLDVMYPPLGHGPSLENLVPAIRGIASMLADRFCATSSGTVGILHARREFP